MKKSLLYLIKSIVGELSTKETYFEQVDDILNLLNVTSHPFTDDDLRRLLSGYFRNVHVLPGQKSSDNDVVYLTKIATLVLYVLTVKLGFEDAQNVCKNQTEVRQIALTQIFTGIIEKDSDLTEEEFNLILERVEYNEELATPSTPGSNRSRNSCASPLEEVFQSPRLKRHSLTFNNLPTPKLKRLAQQRDFEIEMLKEDLKLAEEKISRLNDQNSHLVAELQAERHRRLEAEVAKSPPSSPGPLTPTDSISDQLHAKSRELEDMSIRMFQVQIELAEAVRQREAASKRVESVEHELKLRRETISQLVKDHEELAADFHKTYVQNAERALTIKGLHEMLDELRAEKMDVEQMPLSPSASEPIGLALLRDNVASLEVQLRDSQSRSTSLCCEIETLKDTITQLEALNNSRVGEIEQHIAALTNLRTEKEQLTQNLEATISGLNQEISSVQEAARLDAAKKESCMAALNVQFEASVSESDRLRSEVQCLTVSVKQLGETNDMKSSEIEKNLSTLSRLQQEKEEQKQQLESAKADLTRQLQMLKEALGNEIAAREAKIAELVSHLGTSNADCGRLTSETTQLRLNLAELENAKEHGLKQIEEHVASIAQLRMQLEVTINEKAENKSWYDSTVANLQSQIGETRAEAECALQKKECELIQAKDNISVLENALQGSEVKYNTALHKITSLENKLEESEVNSFSLIEEAAALKSALESTQTTLHASSLELSQLKDENHSLSIARTELTGKLQTSMAEAVELHQRLSKAGQDFHQISTEKSVFERKLKDVATDLERTRTELIEVVQKSKTIEASRNDLIHRTKDLEQSAENLAALLAEKTLELQSVSQKKSALENTVYDLEETIKTIETTKAVAVASLNSELQDAGRRCEELSLEVDGLKISVTELEKSRNATIEKADEYFNTVSHLKAEKSDLEKQFEVATEELDNLRCESLAILTQKQEVSVSLLTATQETNTLRERLEQASVMQAELQSVKVALELKLGETSIAFEAASLEMQKYKDTATVLEANNRDYLERLSIAETSLQCFTLQLAEAVSQLQASKLDSETLCSKACSLEEAYQMTEATKASTIATLTTQLHEAEITVSDLRSKVGLLETSVSKLRESRDAASETGHQHAVEVSQLKAHNHEQERMLEATKAEFKCKIESLLVSHQNEVSSREADFVAVRTELEAVVSKNERLNSESSMLRSVIVELEECKQASSIKINECLASIQTLQGDLEVLRNEHLLKVSEMSMTAEILNSRLEDSQTNHTSVNLELLQLREECSKISNEKEELSAKLHGTVAEMSGVQQQLVQVTESCKILQAEKAIIAGKFEEVNVLLTTTKDELTSYQQKFSSGEAVNNQYAEKLKSLEASVESQNAVLAKRMEDFKALQADRTELSCKATRLEEVLRGSETEKESSINFLSTQLHDVRSEREKLTAEIECFRVKVSQLEEVRRSTEQESIEYKALNEQLRNQLVEQQQKADALTAEISSKERKLEEMRKELGSRESAFESLSNQLETAMDEKAKILQESATLRSRISELELSSGSSHEQVQELMSAVRTLEVQLENVHRQTVEKQSEHSSTVALLQEQVANTERSYNQVVSEKEHQLNDLNNRIAEYETQCNRLEQLKVSKDSRVQELEECLQMEMEEKENLKNQIGEAGERRRELENNLLLENESLNRQMSEAKEKLLAMHTEMEYKASLVSTLMQETQEFRVQLSKKAEELADVLKKKEKLAVAQSQTAVLLQEVESQVQQLNTVVLELKEKEAEIVESKSQLERELEAKTRELVTIQEEKVAAVGESTAAKDQLLSELERLRSELKVKEDALAAKTADLEKLQGAADEVDGKVQRLTSVEAELTTVQSQLESLTSANESVLAELTLAKDERHCALQSLRTVTEELEAVRSQYEEVKLEKENLAQRLEVVADEVGSEERQRNESLVQEINELKQTQREASSAMKVVNQQLVLLSQEHQASLESKGALERQISSLTSEMKTKDAAMEQLKNFKQEWTDKHNAVIEGQQKDLEAKCQEVENFAKYCKEVKERYSSLKVEFQEYKATMDTEVESRQKMEVKIVELREQLQKSESEKKTIKNEVMLLKAENANLAQKVKDYSHKSSSHADLKKETADEMSMAELITSGRRNTIAPGQVFKKPSTSKLPVAVSSRRESTGSVTSSGSTGSNKMVPCGIGKMFHCDEEDGEFFSSSYLSDLKAGKCEPEEDVQGRMSELQRRNSMYPQHLRSAYPTEFGNESLRNDIPDITHATSILSLMTPPAANTRKRRSIAVCNQANMTNDSLNGSQASVDSSETSLEKRRRKEGLQTSYSRPGPPTPARNTKNTSANATPASSAGSRTPLCDKSNSQFTFGTGSKDESGKKSSAIKRFSMRMKGTKNENTEEPTPRKAKIGGFRKPFGSRSYSVNK